jgi:hypothetical protein
MLIFEDSLTDYFCQMELSPAIGNGRPDISGGAAVALQLQCVGCDKNYLWYSVGLPLVSLVRVGLCWACWHSPKLIKHSMRSVVSKEMRDLKSILRTQAPAISSA